MALVKYGGGIIQQSGSIAGNTFARNRYGNYVRSRTKPVNPKSTFQVYARTIISLLAEYWGDTLTPTERESWETYANAIAMKNKLGETIKLSGFNHFIRSNHQRRWYRISLAAPFQSIVKTAPPGNTLPDKDPSVEIDVDSSPQQISVTFNVDMGWCTEPYAGLIMRMGIPQKGTRNFFAGPWKPCMIVLGNAAGLTTPVTCLPCMPVTAGQKVWCTFRITRADGGLTEPWTVSATVHSAAPGEVPMLIGLTQAAAEELLANASLTLGTVTEENHETVPVGLIISQDPAAHTRLNVGDAVNIVVSLGPAA